MPKDVNPDELGQLLSHHGLGYLKDAPREEALFHLIERMAQRHKELADSHDWILALQLRYNDTQDQRPRPASLDVLCIAYIGRFFPPAILRDVISEGVSYRVCESIRGRVASQYCRNLKRLTRPAWPLWGEDPHWSDVFELLSAEHTDLKTRFFAEVRRDWETLFKYYRARAIQQLDLDDLSDIERYRLGKRTVGPPPDPTARPPPRIPRHSWAVEWHPDMAQRPYSAVGENSSGTDTNSDPSGIQMQCQQTAFRPILPRLENGYISNPYISKSAYADKISNPMGWTTSQAAGFPSSLSAQRPFRRYPIHEAMSNMGMAYVPNRTLHEFPPPPAFDLHLATVNTSPESLTGYEWPGANDDAWTPLTAVNLTEDTSLTLNICFTQAMEPNSCTKPTTEIDMFMGEMNPMTTAEYPMEDLSGQATQLSGSWPGFGNEIYIDPQFQTGMPPGIITNTDLGGLGIITTDGHPQEVCSPGQVVTMPQQQM